ncbi:ImmA/IrrE family metallo-endopeptidase [Alicyclobacillus sp. ALC3]|uniref:ImmA/IrrE family metallo-endopeptidase n=1 Tax=Alicyclobacillus sp. ALC3 TaxID=2796143 RepID=UPI002377FB80|nr:ImmA/IrrE family metallo-endopeptidase [Alicyclobacillus sp. ALC3]WDL98166.1 ImmA/IrrE family metallo-endopeptidase [Alicyclobacillus sp. ALC3]
MFDISQYRPVHLESSIVTFYRNNHIRSPQDIDLELFAHDAGIWVHFLAQPSTNYQFRSDMYTVIVDNRLPWEQQRVEMAHELGHVLLHAGRQEFMKDDWRALQEFQADMFAMYSLVPTFMIANCITQASSRAQLVNQLAYSFDVPQPFMDARLTLLEQRLYTIAAENQMATAIREATAGYDYSYRHPTDRRVEYLVKDGSVVGTRRRADI